MRKIIAIDPDIDKSGICVLNASEKIVEYSAALPFFDACQTIRTSRMSESDDIEVYVEAGWLNEKSNFHPAQGRRAEKIAHDVGMNHAAGRLFLSYCETIGIKAHEFRPLKKIWSGPDRKITHAEIEAVIGRKMHRCNQDERDAILIAWVAAGLPISIPITSFRKTDNKK